MIKNECKPLESFYVCDVESFKWCNLIVMGLTDGEMFFNFGVSRDDYSKFFLKFRFKPAHQPLRPYTRSLPVYEGPAIKNAMDAFFEVLLSDGKSKSIYAHFGGKFDFLFVLNHVFFHTDFKVENMIPRGSGLLCFDVLIDYGNEKTVKLTFRDSSALLPFSLKSITKNFGVESMKKDWDHRWSLPFMTEDMCEYNRVDCQGLHESITKYFSQPIIKRAGGASTIAGQAMRVLRTLSDTTVHSLHPRVDQFVRRAYFGGRTEIFKPLFTGPGLIRCADVNSLYPTVMREVPEVGNIPREYPCKFSHFDFQYQPDKIGFYEAEVEVPDHMYCPPLGVVWEIDGGKKFIFPTGRFRGSWSTIELEYARSLGVKIIKTGQGAIFSSEGNFFKRYVDELYEIRENTPRESVDNVIAKLLLNSCYGRFGLRVERENLVLDEGQVGIKLGRNEDGFTLGEGETKIKLVKEARTLNTFNNVAVAAWVTSCSRVFMHRLYSKIENSLYYTDTDSMFTTDFFKDEKGLGKLKIEYEAASACFLLPKTYVIDGVKDQDFTRKVTMKGFDRKKTKQFTIEDFQLALEGDLRRLNVRAEPKFATFKTALGKGKILTMLPRSEREIRSMYDKRIIEKTCSSYDTRAHKIKNHEPIWSKNYEIKQFAKGLKVKPKAIENDAFLGLQVPTIGDFTGNVAEFFANA